MKIYTKTGDKGETGLLAGGRIGKDAVRIQAYGTVDECNAVLGIVRTHDIGEQLDAMLERIQHQLFVVGSDLATPGGQRAMIDRIGDNEVEELEADIDRLQKSLPPLKAFILPGGSPGAAYLHLARTVCRRAERLAVTLSHEETTAAQVVKFLNRLSDFLFVAARAANIRAGIKDRLWNSPRRGNNR